VYPIKETYHPNAYLQHVKNVKSGLKARTKILNGLDEQPGSASSIAKNTVATYDAVMHHLRLLETEGTVSRRGKRPFIWLITGLGQKRLVS
jgi:predicted ArsR family transcriptional regulator